MITGKPFWGIQLRTLITGLLTFASLLLSSCGPTKQISTKAPLVVYQPSHQSDTGKDFNEAMVCNNIAEAAMAASTGVVRVHKVWSYNQENLHHAREGSNTKIDHSAAID